MNTAGPEVFHEQDVLGPDMSGDAALELGSIGWDDSDLVFDPGDGTNGGGTLIRVQLYRGRNPGHKPADNRAHGAKTIAQIPGGAFRIPPKDTMCLIGHPHKMQTAPGAAVLLATLDKVSSSATFGNIKEGELCLHGDGADALSRMLFKANGAISIFALEGNAPGGKPVAILVDAQAGSITLLNQHGTLALTSDQVAMLFPPGGISIDHSGNVTLIGKSMVIQGEAARISAGSLDFAVANGSGLTVGATGAATLTALTALLQATTVDLGIAARTGVATQATMATWMGNIATALTAIQACLVYLPGAGNPPLAGLLTASAAAIGVASSTASAAFSLTVKAAP